MNSALTKKQLALHWRHWRACQEVNGWIMAGGSLGGDAQRTRALSLYHTVVWQQAERLAADEPVTADDLRHGSYLVATSDVHNWGPNTRPVVSIHNIGNRELTRVLALWDLLIDPDDLKAGMVFNDPCADERETLVAGIARRASEPVVRAIAASALGTRNYETCGLSDLRRLNKIVLARCGRRPHQGAMA